jgi:hypothetical protein
LVFEPGTLGSPFSLRNRRGTFCRSVDASTACGDRVGDPLPRQSDRLRITPLFPELQSRSSWSKVHVWRDFHCGWR